MPGTCKMVWTPSPALKEQKVHTHTQTQTDSYEQVKAYTHTHTRGACIHLSFPSSRSRRGNADIEGSDPGNRPGGPCLPVVSQSYKAGVDWSLGDTLFQRSSLLSRIVSVGLRSSQSPASHLKCCLFSCFRDLTAAESPSAASRPGREVKAELSLRQLLVLTWWLAAWQLAVYGLDI